MVDDNENLRHSGVFRKLKIVFTNNRETKWDQGLHGGNVFLN